MTVYVPQGKISWKISVPLVIFFLACGVAIWFFPVREYYKLNEIMAYVLNGFVSFMSLVASGMVLCWTFWGDYVEEKRGK